MSKPPWLIKKLPHQALLSQTETVLASTGLSTVCEEALCPNRGECYSCGTATFLILGKNCTRSCRFCAVGHEPPCPPRADEPLMIAEAVRRLGIKHAVITSVTRDDLTDGGALQFAKTISITRETAPGVRIEVLIPDFQGSDTALSTVLDARPDILGHNIETVPRLYPSVRPGASYERSLTLLANAASRSITTKSGIMLGLGETMEEIILVMRDLHDGGCTILTLGQYLQPRKDLLPVQRYIPPGEFVHWRESAFEIGFTAVASGPFVRSSYHASELFETVVQQL